MQLVAITIYTGFGGVALRELDQPDTHAGYASSWRSGTRRICLGDVCKQPAGAWSDSHRFGTADASTAPREQRPIAGLDVIAVPLIFIFAWVYTVYGPLAAAALWAPILGLRQVHRTNLELEQTNEELLELMVKSLEARDPYTSGHSRRVQQYSTIIARAIGLSEKQIEQIGRAALLHDVGKIYEKYAAVFPSRTSCTPEEWAIIQDHPLMVPILLAR